MGILRGLGIWLALVPSLLCGAVSPKVTEVDVVFPRNETFSPSPLFPIVFAIQSPSVLSTLRPILSYLISEPDNGGTKPFYVGDTILLFQRNLSNATDPYFLYWSVDLPLEGNFQFSWVLTGDNCTYDSEADEIKRGILAGQEASFNFTTKHGAPSPDFDSFVKTENCNRTLAQAVHVPSALEYPPRRQEALEASSCAVSPDFSPTPSPCNVKMDSSAIASISASLTAKVCENPLRTGVSCPTPSSENAASTWQLPVPAAWTLVIGTWLAYSLA